MAMQMVRRRAFDISSMLAGSRCEGTASGRWEWMGHALLISDRRYCHAQPSFRCGLFGACQGRFYQPVRRARGRASSGEFVVMVLRRRIAYNGVRHARCGETYE